MKDPWMKNGVLFFENDSNGKLSELAAEILSCIGNYTDITVEQAVCVLNGIKNTLPRISFISGIPQVSKEKAAQIHAAEKEQWECSSTGEWY